MMERKLSIIAVSALLLAGMLFSSEAQAITIDFNLPNISFFGPSYSQDGYTFTSSNGTSEAYINYVNVGGTAANFNADGLTADLVEQSIPATITITNNLNTPFNFTSIGLADIVNRDIGGRAEFTFNHTSGPSDTVIVDLTPGIFGLQNFTFNESNLTSVTFLPDLVFAQNAGVGFPAQFDNVGVSTGVLATPLPGSLLLFASGLLGLMFLGHRRVKSSVKL
jgi:hypothetical protein